MQLNTTGLFFNTGNLYLYTGYWGFNVSKNWNKLFNFSDPSNPISNFTAPYSAKLIGDTGLIAVAQSLQSLNCLVGNRSGVLSYTDNSTIYSTCFGFGEGSQSFYFANNYYCAFYPQGYYSPNFGENYSIFKANTNGYTNLQNGGCLNIDITDYNLMFGISSMTAGNTQISTDTLAPNIYSPLVTPQIVCPPPAPIPFYFQEINFYQIPGTTLGLGAGTTWNDNPIPTSLDNLSYKVNGRYQLSGDPASTQNNPINDVIISNGRALTSISTGTPEDKLNNNICQATTMETSVFASNTLNGQQLINAPDLNPGSIGSQVVFNNAIMPYYWNWIYKENAYSLPFTNYNSNPSSTPGEVGSNLFNYTLSSSDYFWKFKQCASNIDFLPWTAGASILACPSEFFEIPYYAAIRKFGFYGTRFLNTCNSLNLQNNIGNVPNASELNLTVVNQVIPPETEPQGIDQPGSWSFTLFDNLLRVANYEEMYSNMYAGNKGFFLWANSGNLLNDNLYSNINNSGFNYQLNVLFGIFNNIFSNGISSITGNQPNVLLYENIANTEYLITTSGTYSDFLFNNQVYENFKNISFSLLNQNQLSNWNLLENKYAYGIVNSDGSINQNFYQSVISGKQQRIRTRYFENLLRGNPIDLYPLNSITFSTDSASGYIESPFWGKSLQFFGANNILPQVNRQYFEGAYGQSSNITNLQTQINSLVNSQTNYFYPGIFNNLTCATDNISPKYDIVTGGLILDSQNRPFSINGWLAVGYNEIGKLNKNFSCFTPIFIQQPLKKVYCKIGQTPTFRTLAVDYHTLPEDKISSAYPEIIYWAVKLKLLDCNNKYLYPMNYQWYRIPISNFDQFMTNPGYYMNLTEVANVSGDWCCLEGNNSPNCTLIHPTECFPNYNTGLINPNEYTFIKGSQYGIDDQYYYFNMASGRFGIKMSNPSQLNIENWVQFDISIRNGMNNIGSVSVNFIVNDYNGNTNTITIPQVNSNSLQNYQGYQFDNLQVPETVVRQKVPPPNAGFGDVTSYTFIGPILYRGELRTYTPSFLNDTRALYETWGSFIDYGPLIQMYSNLTQEQGELLYGYSHLPVCTNYQMNNGQKGVQAIFNYNGANVQQFTITQQAFAALGTSQGTPYIGIGNIGNLYPPILDPNNFANGFAIGNGWQFAQNLGTIKRFGYSTTTIPGTTNNWGSNLSPDIQIGSPVFTNITPIPTTQQVISWLKTNLLKPDALAGSNCGYIPYGAGRMVGYYLEAYDSFYIACNVGLKDNQNITDLNFISPGYRMGNAAIQYNWLGKPYNTYLDRKSLYGPYAYKWRVNRHNRDRNGNGISEGFYSMGYDEPYSLMYDLPAFFGLNIRTPNVNPGYLNLINQINNYRSQFFSTTSYTIQGLRNISFGTLIDPSQEGTNYGDIQYSCDLVQNNANFTGLCPYMSASLELANSPDVYDYNCPSLSLKEGKCFDPLLSQQDQFGFFPGGKSLDMMTAGNATKLVPMASIVNNQVVLNDIPSVLNKNTYFRAAINTPYYYNIQTSDEGIFEQDNSLNGLNPCNDGGSELANFITPIIALNNLYSLQSLTSTYNSIISSSQQIFEGNI